MKKILILLAAPVLISSCKKDDDATSPGNNTTNSTSCLITEERDSTGNKLETTYEYDASKRLIKMTQYTDGVISGYNTFTYNGSTISVQDFKADNTADGAQGTILLNSSGYIIEQRQSKLDTVDGVPGTTLDTVRISYNAAGQMSSMDTRSWTRSAGGNLLKNSSMSMAYEFSGGRQSKATNNFSSSEGGTTQTSSSVTTYTYDNASPVVTSNPVIGFLTIAGSSLFGKLGSDRIPSRSDVVSTINGQSYNSYSTYNAVIDSKGNPTKIRTFTDYGGIFNDSNTTLYSYSCP
jgi:hypothetical protein